MCFKSAFAVGRSILLHPTIDFAQTPTSSLTFVFFLRPPLDTQLLVLFPLLLHASPLMNHALCGCLVKPVFFFFFFFAKPQCILGAVLNALGAGIKYIANFVEVTPSADPNLQFAVVMIGQTLAAAAQPFILGAPTMLAATWFGDKERATANMLASMGMLPWLAVVPRDWHNLEM